MPYSTLDVLSLIAGCFLVVYGITHIAALFFARLQHRFLGILAPNNFPTRTQKRAAYIRALAYAGWPLALGLSFILRHLSYHVCTNQDTLSLLPSLFMIFGSLCLLLASFVQQRYQLTPPGRTINPKLTRLANVLVIGIVFGFLSLVFFWISRIPTSFESLNAVHMVSAKEGWAVGSANFRGIIYHYQNGRWTKEVPNLPSMVMDLDMVSPTEGWAVSNGDFMLHLVDGVWTQQPNPARELSSIDMISSTEGWAVGNFGTILHYADGTWTQVASPTTQTLESISMVSATEGWAVGGGDYYQRVPSVILHYSNGTWALAPNPVQTPLTSVDMVSADDGWAVGGTGFYPIQSVILRYQQGVWKPVSSPVTIPLAAITMVSATEGWAIGGDFFRVPLQCAEASQTVRINAILHYKNGTWETVSSPNDEALKGVDMVSANAGWIVGWNTVLKYENHQWVEFQRLSR